MAIRKPVFFNYVEGVDQEIDATADSIALGQLVLNGIGGVGINAQGTTIQNVALPTQPGDASNKQYVDATAAGLSYKAPVLAASTSNVSSLSGTTTLDGVSVPVGSRVLLLSQTDATQNGIWVVQTGAWTRPADFAAGTHQASAAVFIESGATFADQGYTLIVDPPNDVIGTNTLTFVQYTGLGEVITGNGLQKSGNTISINLAPAPGLQFTSGALDTFLNASGGLAKDGNGLKALLAYQGTVNQTLTSDQNGIAVTGVPSKFTVAGVSTTATVTAAGLNTVTGGPTSLADSQHQHQNVLSAMTVTDYHSCSTALSAGDPVAWGSTGNTLIRADASVDAASRVIGIAAISAAANTTVAIIKRGIAANVITGATAGAPVFLNSGGGLTLTAPTGGTLNILRVGYLQNSTNIDVNPFFLGKRSA